MRWAIALIHARQKLRVPVILGIGGLGTAAIGTPYTLAKLVPPEKTKRIVGCLTLAIAAMIASQKIEPELMLGI
jgi:uncharacterized membrane protein YfcA